MWREKLIDFIRWDDVDIRYLYKTAQAVPNLIPRRPSKKGYEMKRREIGERLSKDLETSTGKAKEDFIELLDLIVEQTLEEGFSSLTWPTMIEEPNLSLVGEKEPTEEDVWRLLFLIYSSVRFGRYAINLDNVTDAGRKWLWTKLVTGKVILKERADLSPIREELHVDVRNSEPMFVSLSLLGFIVKRIEEELKGEEEDIFAKFLPKLGWREDTSLVIFGRVGKGIFNVFPRVSKVVQRWLQPPEIILSYLNAFTNLRIEDKKKDLLRKEREKLIYYLLKYDHINGELLSKLTSLKCSYELEVKGGYRGIPKADKFFSML